MTIENLSKLSDKTKLLIAREDEKLNKRCGYNANSIKSNVESLLVYSRVEVGWRNSCGKTDPTMHVNSAWLKVVKALRKDGFVLSEVPVKHDNGWATKAGGFWSSIIYTIPKNSADSVLTQTN